MSHHDEASTQALVSKDKEPITPFISKIRVLAARGVSCVLVMGGSGDYFDVADRVICMEAFQVCTPPESYLLSFSLPWRSPF